jgi:hypothetical protein
MNLLFIELGITNTACQDGGLESANLVQKLMERINDEDSTSAPLSKTAECALNSESST